MAQFEKLDKTVFYYPDARSIAMATNGTERLRIDTEGHFRFGAKGEAKDERVRIEGETSDDSKLALNVTDSNQKTLLAVRNDGHIGVGTTSPNRPLTVRAKEQSEELISFEDPAGQTRWHFNQKLGGDKPGFNIVETGVADGRVFIQAGTGNVGIGTTAPNHRLDVNGNVNYGQLAKLDVADNFTATIRAADLGLGHSTRRGSPGRALVDLTRELHINYAGDWPDGVRYYGALLGASSRELKEQIENLSIHQANEILQNLNPVQFNFIMDDKKTRHLGFIAEDSHDLVTSTDRNAITTEHIVAVLTKIVKEQQATVASLTEKVKDIEAKNQKTAPKTSRRTQKRVLSLPVKVGKIRK